MAKTYTFRPKSSGAGNYVDRVAQKSGMDKSEIIRRSILLAEQVGLFDDAISEGSSGTSGGVDESDLDDSRGGGAPEQGGGVRADDLARMEEEQGGARDDDAPQSPNSDTSSSFWEGW